jgi:hypothetical protein
MTSQSLTRFGSGVEAEVAMRATFADIRHRRAE